MMLRKTLDLIQQHQWNCVLLRALSKRPSGASWIITSDLARIREHVEEGGNLGLVCDKVAVLDFDDLDKARKMMDEVGPLPITVVTGSGKWHCYVRYEDLPARLPNGAGEIQRGPRQQVVMPPSVHPDTHQPYVWNSTEVPTLPQEWRRYLISARPDFIPESSEGVPSTEWDGPPAEEIIARAMLRPGARRRHGGVKFQCPGCAAEGHDKHRDNATVFPDGRWGCALDRRHSGAIGAVLGFMIRDAEESGEEPDVDYPESDAAAMKESDDDTNAGGASDE